ncbi:glycosyltransferase family 29 protein [Pseudoscourfieldia marina]
MMEEQFGGASTITEETNNDDTPVLLDDSMEKEVAFGGGADEALADDEAALRIGKDDDEVATGEPDEEDNGTNGVIKAAPFKEEMTTTVPRVVERISLCPEPEDLALLRVGGFCLSADTALKDKLSSDDVAAVAATENVLVSDAIRRLLPNRLLIRDLAAAAHRNPESQRRWKPDKETLLARFNHTYALEKMSEKAKLAEDAQATVEEFENSQEFEAGAKVTGDDEREGEITRRRRQWRRRRLQETGSANVGPSHDSRKNEALRTSSHFTGSVYVHHKNAAEFGSSVLKASKPFLPPDAESANRGLRHRSCAVVGSSGILTRSLFGEEIDAHDAVYRVNQAPTRGNCALYAGARSTVRVLNAHWLHRYARGGTSKDLPLERNVTIVVSRYDAKLVSALQNRILALQRTDVSMRIVSRRVFSALSRVLLLFRKSLEEAGLYLGGAGGRVPSTGVLTAYLAMHMCANVSLYGFGLTSARDAALYQEGLMLARRDPVRSSKVRESVLESALATNQRLAKRLSPSASGGALLASLNAASATPEIAQTDGENESDIEKTIFEDVADELTEEAADEGAQLADSAVGDDTSKQHRQHAWKRLEKKVSKAIGSEADADAEHGEDLGTDSDVEDEPDEQNDEVAEDSSRRRRRLHEVLHGSGGQIWYHYFAHMYGAQRVDRDAHAFDVERLFLSTLARTGDVRLCSWRRVDRLREQDGWRATFVTARDAAASRRYAVRPAREPDTPPPRLMYFEQKIVVGKDGSRRSKYNVRSFSEMHHVGQKQIVEELRSRDNMDKKGKRRSGGGSGDEDGVTMEDTVLTKGGRSAGVLGDMYDRTLAREAALKRREMSRIDVVTNNLAHGKLNPLALLKRSGVTIDKDGNVKDDGPRLRKESMTKHLDTETARIAGSALAGGTRGGKPKAATTAITTKASRGGGAAENVDFIDDAKVYKTDDLKLAKSRLIGPRKPDAREKRASFEATATALGKPFLEAREELGYRGEPVV